MSIENQKRHGCETLFEVKKNASGIGMYPLCIDTTDKIL